jgi:hypothetical protein
MFVKKDARTRHKTINNKIIMKKEETTAQKSPGSARAFFYLFWADFQQPQLRCSSQNTIVSLVICDEKMRQKSQIYFVQNIDI